MQLPSLFYNFSSPTAAFVPSDVGRQIRIRNASLLANNKLLTIAGFISATEVELFATDTFSLPEPNNGVLQWAVVRLYTDLPPLLPRYDEINNDLLEAIVETTSGGFETYGADHYCWEDGFSTTAHVEVLSVATVSPGVQRVSMTGTTAFPTTPEIILRVGNWEFVSLVPDVAGTGDTIADAAPNMELMDAAAAFTDANVGQWIKLGGATTAANNGVYLITEVLASNTLHYFNGLGTPESFGGTWTTYNEATFFVETVPVLTQALAAGATSGTGDSIAKAGSICTITDAAAAFVPTMVGKHILLAGATSTNNNGIYVVTAYISATQIKYKNFNGVTEVFAGTWSVGLGIYTLDLSSAIAPTSPGPAKLRYNCPAQLTCDYCGASKVFALVEATPALLAETGTSVERLLERVMLRLQAVTPAHVELVVRYRTSISASLNLTASVESSAPDGLLVASLTAFFDDIPGDVIPADSALVATVEPTMV